mgnify:CR=1 FL=1
MLIRVKRGETPIKQMRTLLSFNEDRKLSELHLCHDSRRFQNNVPGSSLLTQVSVIMNEIPKPSPKYGPLTIHQNAKAVKVLMATPTPVIGASSHIAHSLENVRLSLHVERFESQERFSEDIICITRFPEYGYELKHSAPCEMRVGQTHAAAVVQSTCICVDFEDFHDTTMEVEYSRGEESLAVIAVSIKFPPPREDE